MPNELVPVHPARFKNLSGRRRNVLAPDLYIDGDQQAWDLPPPYQDSISPESPVIGYQDARSGRRHGEHGFAAVRATDAAENAQTVWDLGDTKTWLLILAMFFFGLLLAGGAYALPHGRDASTPPIHLY